MEEASGEVSVPICASDTVAGLGLLSMLAAGSEVEESGAVERLLSLRTFAGRWYDTSELPVSDSATLEV